jgi:hypothetical protein
MQIDTNATDLATREAPTTRLESLVSDYDELRGLYARTIRELDALAARGFDGPEGIDRLRAWTALVSTARDLVDRMHAIREHDVMVGSMVGGAIDATLDRITTTTTRALRDVVATIEADAERKEIKAKIDSFVSTVLPTLADAAAEGTLDEARRRFGLFVPGAAS